MTNITFYRCPICGNVVMKILDSTQDLICCGQPMQVLAPNTADASNERHIPVIAQVDNDVTVSVGVIPHPMTTEHFIQWIFLESTKGGQLRYLNPDDEPVANFRMDGGAKPICIYTYCNLHSLWKKELQEDKDETIY